MRFLEKFSVGLLIAWLLGMFYLGNNTAYAAQLRPEASCTEYVYGSIALEDVFTIYDTYSWCQTNHAYVDTYLADCSTTTSHDAEADTWQTQVTHAGGTRYNETGRSGWVTYPPNCYAYYVQKSYLTLQTLVKQLPDPSYGCTWFAVDDNVYNSRDYQCGLFPHS